MQIRWFAQPFSFPRVCKRTRSKRHYAVIRLGTRYDQRPPTVEYNQPILAHKLLDRSPDRISAYAVLVGQLKLARRQLASGGYGVI